ncbi:hypothetical protein Gorai_000249, partial [Gossypium raimondii]|nr:hypothetical protein [Gossypium raimondii]
DIAQINLTPDFNKTIVTILGNTVPALAPYSRTYVYCFHASDAFHSSIYQSNLILLFHLVFVDVEIHWRGQDLLAINPIQKEGFGLSCHIDYEVKALSAKRFADKIIVKLPSTGQRVEVDVNYEPDEKSEATINFSFWAKVMGSIALTVITLIIGFICFLDRPLGSSQPPSTPLCSSSISAPVTPDRRSPLHLDEQSPRTPQPFVDYVRRTIDETPYYRREGRRRFNPQNTY